MAQPTEYERIKDFTENVQGEFDSPALNAELDKAGNSINEIRANLALIQRDDGGLVNGVVDEDALSDDFKESLTATVTSNIGEEILLDMVNKHLDELNIDERISQELEKIGSTAAVILDEEAGTSSVYSSSKTEALVDGKLDKTGGVMTGDISFASDATISAPSLSIESETASVSVGTNVVINDGSAVLTAIGGTVTYTGTDIIASDASVTVSNVNANNVICSGTLHANTYIANRISCTENGSFIEDSAIPSIRGIRVVTGGTYGASGASAIFRGNDATTDPGTFEIQACLSSTLKKVLKGTPEGDLLWDTVSLIMPVGIVLPYAGKTVPNGWLLCNGQEVSRTTFAKLFVAIGTTYGTGDGSTTFTLPNLTDRFVQGKTTPVSNIEQGLPNITGSFDIYSVGRTDSSAARSGAFTASKGTKTGAKDHDGTNWKVDFDASKSNSIYGKTTSVQPPAVGMLYIIKAF